MPEVKLAKAKSIAISIIAAVVIVIVFWQLASFILGSERFPDIVATGNTLVTSFTSDSIIEAQGGGSHGYYPHVLATAGYFTSGFVVGSGVGFLLSLTLFQLPRLMHHIDPVLEFMRVLPPLLVIPFAVLFFRSMDALPAITVALYSAFTVGLYSLNALRNIPANYTTLAKFLGANKWRQVIDVQIPAVIPSLLGAVRVAAILGLGIAIVAEYMAAPAGIGRVMKFAMSFSRIDLLFVGVVWVVAIAIVVELAIFLVTKPLIAWTDRAWLR